jgi:hypothetical protein
MNNLQNYETSLKTAARDENEKYIGRGWYKYINEHRPKLGDLLIFSMDNRSDYIYVKLIRKEFRHL